MESGAGQSLRDLDVEGVDEALNQRPERVALGGVQERLGVHRPGLAGDFDLVALSGPDGVDSQKYRRADDPLVPDVGDLESRASVD
jgi:hypothetical protein